MRCEQSSAQCKLIDFLLLVAGFKLHTPNVAVRFLNLSLRVMSCAFNYAELFAASIVLAGRGASVVHWAAILPRSLVPIFTHHYMCWKRSGLRATFSELDEHFPMARQHRSARWAMLAFAAWSSAVIVSFTGLLTDVIHRGMNGAGSAHQLITGLLSPFYAVYRAGWLHTLLLLQCFTMAAVHRIDQQLLLGFSAQHASAIGRRTDLARQVASARGRLQLVKRSLSEILGTLIGAIATLLFTEFVAIIVTASSGYSLKQPIVGFWADFVLLALMFTLTIFYSDRVKCSEKRATELMMLYLNTAAMAAQPSNEADDCCRIVSSQVAASPVIDLTAAGLPLDRGLVLKLAAFALPAAVVMIQLLPLSELNISGVTTTTV